MAASSVPKESTSISRCAYRLDRSYAWNYAHAPALPRVRRIPSGPGSRLFDYALNSSLGVSAGPLLNSKWVEAYARLGFDILAYSTVRTMPRQAHSLPNILHVENREAAAVATRRARDASETTLAVSLGLPSMEPEVWRRDVRRARERLGKGQVLVVSVVGTHVPGADADALIGDYALCAAWAADAGADIVEVHLACPDPFAEQPQMIFENIPLSAQILYRVRTTVPVPVIAKLGAFRTPRGLHETATKLAPWTHGFSLVHAIHRWVVDEKGNPAFDGTGRDRAEITGSATFPLCSRQVLEMISWRRAGAWDRPILGTGGVTTVDRARLLLREGTDIVMVGTAAMVDPLFAVRFREALATAAA